MEIGKNKIRIVFYICTVTLVLILLTLMSSTFISSFKSQTLTKIDQLATGIYNMKKIYVKDIIDRTIQDIDIERERILTSEIENLNSVSQIIESIALEYSNLTQIHNQIIAEKIAFPEVQIFIYDRIDGQLKYEINNDLEINPSIDEGTLLKMYPSNDLTRIIRHDDYHIILNINPNFIEEVVKFNMSHRIRNEVLVDNGYIWINQIVNYDGGDDYGIRLVHPNMPETEGIFLSTNTEDIHGNHPYLNELEGVKKDGELFQDYYFKKKDSDEIAHKLSYAQLYQPYDWVIATGVYLDDIDTLVLKETHNMQSTQKQIIIKTLFLAGLCLLISITLLYFFEKLISRLILQFQNEVNSKNKELEIEKNKIEKIACLDSLTDLLTRRAMQINLEKAHANAVRHQIGYAIGIGDIDFFKRINDQYGHQAGDYVLQQLATVFKRHLRADDSIARWGGEEFLFLLNNTTVQDAIHNMDRLRALVEKTEFIYENQKIKVSISIGVTGFNPELNTFDVILKRADKHLYEAKSTGRNKVVG